MGTLLTDSGIDWSIDSLPTQSMDMSTLPAQRARASANTIGKIGLFSAVVGGINQAIGSYYQAKSAQYQAKSQASTMRFQSDMALINARSEENNAQGIMDAGQKQIGQYTMAAGQAKSAAKSSMASRGLVLGEGNTRDVEASMDIVKSIDTLTINSNTVRAAEAARMQGTNYKNQSLLDLTSAKNIDASASSISPGLAGFTSLLGSASNVASQWYYRNRRAGMSDVVNGNY